MSSYEQDANQGIFIRIYAFLFLVSCCFDTNQDLIKLCIVAYNFNSLFFIHHKIIINAHMLIYAELILFKGYQRIITLTSYSNFEMKYTCLHFMTFKCRSKNNDKKLFKF